VNLSALISWRRRTGFRNGEYALELSLDSAISTSHVVHLRLEEPERAHPGSLKKEINFLRDVEKRVSLAFPYLVRVEARERCSVSMLCNAVVHGRDEPLHENHYQLS
jgi:hypothetical protein